MKRFYLLVIFTVVIFVISTNADILVYERGSSSPSEEFHDLPARFGASFPANGMRVLAVKSNPENGCQNISAPPATNKSEDANIRWAVLIARYDCSFEQKIRNAQAAGYSSAIVYNLNSNDLEQMSANNPDGINITAMFVGEMTARIIMYTYLWHNNYALVLNGDLPFNINTHLILPFSIVVGLCFLTMIGFMIVKCVREQRRLRRHRLPGSVLKKIPIIRFNKEQHVSLYEICAICLDDYVDGDKLRVLPCAHAYHSKCIDPWLTKNRRVCPICKRKVFARGEPRLRRRRSTDDSMSDSDHDDTTPLLNPVDHSNHGTFDAALPAAAISDRDNRPGYPQQRFNPFDRQVNVPAAAADDDAEPTFWTKFMNMFHPNIAAAADDQHLPNDTHDDESSGIATQPHGSESIGVLITPHSSSSNNILNSSLSGSFQKCRPKIAASSADGDEDDDDEQCVDAIEPSNTIFAPLSRSQPQFNQLASEIAPGTSHQRIAVAAIPNVNFAQSSMQRAVSSSTPAVYETHQTQQRRNNSTSGNSSDGDGNARIGNYKRAAATSSDYFV